MVNKFVLKKNNYKLMGLAPVNLLLAVVGFFVVAGIFFACGKEGGGDNTQPPVADGFKTEMLINYADNLIIPALKSFQDKTVVFETSVEAFFATPNAATQAKLKTDFSSMYQSYEVVSVTNFGPAEALLLYGYLNSFAPNTEKIEEAVASGKYNFNLPLVSDSIQGLPALDYLLFSTNVLNNFTENGSSSNRKKYVQDVVARIKQLTTNVQSQWATTYRNYFTTSLQTNVGSSIGNLGNRLAFEMDAMKGPRIGWPFGKQSNNKVHADRCEGYYAGISKELAIANLTAVKSYFTGGTGNGLDDYLSLLKKDALKDKVLAQFDVAIAALNQIPGLLSDALTANKEAVENAYKQVQLLLTLIKTEVSSELAIQINYQDNDGD